MNKNSLINFLGLISLAFISFLFLSFQILNFLNQSDYHSLIKENYYWYSNVNNLSANAPYVYRLLTYKLLNVFLGPNPEISNFFKLSLVFRLIQNYLILFLFYKYLNSLKIQKNLIIFGILLLTVDLHLAFGNSQYFYFDSYMNLIIFLIAGLLINSNKYLLILPLTLIAAFNREESIFISLFILANYQSISDQAKIIYKNKVLLTSFLSFLIALLILIGLRSVLTSSKYNTSFYGEVYPGVDLALVNLVNKNTYLGILKVFNITLLPLFNKKYFRSNYIYFILLLVFPWFLSQLFFGSTNETRLFVPLLIILFIPKFLLFIENHSSVVINRHTQLL